MTPLNWTIASWVIFVLAVAWPTWFAARQVWRWRRRRSHCESCGYSLHARVSDRCPECGHNVVSPSRLIDPRWMALHTTIILELLVASHLFYRLEAIQKRGWIAAVPTTVLIFCLPYQPDEPSDGALLSQYARELAFRISDEIGPIYSSVPSAQADHVHAWQLRWIIRKALRISYGPDVPDTGWRAQARGIIFGAHGADRLTPLQRDRAERMCYITLRTRPVWPSGGKVFAEIDCQSLVAGDGYRFTAEARTPGFVDYQSGWRSIDSVLDIRDDFKDKAIMLGVTGRAGPVEYELVVERFHYQDHGQSTWEEISREIRVITTVSDSPDDMMRPFPIPEQLLVGLKPALAVNLVSTSKPGVYLHLKRDDSLRQALGDAAFGVSVSLYRDGELFGRGSGAWLPPRRPALDWLAWYGGLPWYSPWYSDSTPLWYVEVEPAAVHIWQEADFLGPHEWTLVVRGDPIVALQDFDATSYWAGRHEFKNIPIGLQH